MKCEEGQCRKEEERKTWRVSGVTCKRKVHEEVKGRRRGEREKMV